MTINITVPGGLTAEPTLNYTNDGTPWVSGTVASSDRVLNRDTGKWEDGKDRLFMRFTAWGPLAENIAASGLAKGASVEITGKLLTREYQDKAGNQRSSTEMKLTDFAVSLKHATATVTRASQQGQGGGFGQGAGVGSSGGGNAPQNGFGDPGVFGAPEPF